jgi:hypothetical protein
MSNKIKNAITEGGGLAGGAANALTDIADSALTGLSPLNDIGKYFTGLRAIIKVNNRLFGFAFAVTMNIKMDTEEIWTVDNALPYEMAPRKMLANGTISMFHIPGRGPGTRHIHSDNFSFLMQKYISLELSDQTTGELIFKTDKAMIVGRQQDVSAEKISTIKLDWKAIEWQTERPPAAPTGFDKNRSDGGGEGGEGFSRFIPPFS